MPNVSSKHPQASGTSAAASSTQPDKLSRPGWPEVIVGLVVIAVIGLGGASQFWRLGLGSVAYGLLFALWSGVAGFAAFGAAALLRIRSWSAFGVRRVSWRWLLIGVGGGLLAFVVKTVAILAYVQLTGDSANPQTMYAEGAGGGALSLILATLFLGIVTPLGEEFLFRGVVANALLRYGPFIGVVGSALIFALFHGISIVFPAALVVGLINAELFRRSGSVWPGVVVHIVFNLPTIPVMVIAGMS